MAMGLGAALEAEAEVDPVNRFGLAGVLAD